MQTLRLESNIKFKTQDEFGYDVDKVTINKSTFCYGLINAGKIVLFFNSFKIIFPESKNCEIILSNIISAIRNENQDFIKIDLNKDI